MTISDAFALYGAHVIQYQGLKEKTAKNYDVARNSLVAAIGDIPIELVSLEHVIIWKQHMDAKGNAPSSERTNIFKLKCVLKFLAKRGLRVMDAHDISLPKLRERRPTWLNFKEVLDLIDAAKSPRDKAIIACLYSTGCRISELLSLNREDIEKDEVTVCGKGDKYREVYIDKTARAYLNKYLETRKDNYAPLFLSGQRARITVSRVQQIIHKCAADIGIEKNVTPHVFRHTYITDLVVNGAPLPAVQELAGHTNIQTTKIYTHFNTSEKRKVHELFHTH